MVSRKMRYASLAGVGLMTMSLVACANEQDVQVLGDSVQTQKTMQENGIQTIEQSKLAEKCEEYELQPDGSYKCDDDEKEGYTGSGAGMFWFFNGHTYGSHNAMVASNDYKKNNLSTGTKFATKADGRTENKNSKSKSKGGSNNSKNNSFKSSSKSSSSGKSSGFGGGARGGSGGS